MSEAKNTALGSFAVIGYSQVMPTGNNPTSPHLQLQITMIFLTLLIAALVLFTAWDTSEAS